MKNLTRIIVFAVIAFSTLTTFAQKKEKKFIGTVTYTVESVGATPIPVHSPEQTAKIFNERVSLNDGNILINGRILYQVVDLSQVQLAANQLGIGDYYTGPWKGYIKNELTQGTLDSLFTENYKIEYLDETKDIAGVTAKKAKVINVNENDGTTKENEVWYSENMGPEYDIAYISGLKGFPLEFTIFVSEDSALKMTAKEITKKKLKEAEFLLPAGYDEITPEQLKVLQEVIEELMESMPQ